MPSAASKSHQTTTPNDVKCGLVRLNVARKNQSASKRLWISHVIDRIMPRMKHQDGKAFVACMVSKSKRLRAIYADILGNDFVSSCENIKQPAATAHRLRKKIYKDCIRDGAKKLATLIGMSLWLKPKRGFASDSHEMRDTEPTNSGQRLDHTVSGGPPSIVVSVVAPAVDRQPVQVGQTSTTPWFQAETKEPQTARMDEVVKCPVVDYGDFSDNSLTTSSFNFCMFWRAVPRSSRVAIVSILGLALIAFKDTAHVASSLSQLVRNPPLVSQPTTLLFYAMVRAHQYQPSVIFDMSCPKLNEILTDRLVKIPAHCHRPSSKDFDFSPSCLNSKNPGPLCRTVPDRGAFGALPEGSPSEVFTTMMAVGARREAYATIPPSPVLLAQE